MSMAALSFLLAQGNLSGELTGGLIGALAGGGFSLWYGWYTTTITIPRMQTESRAERESLIAELKSERAEFLATLKSEREIDRSIRHDERNLLSVSMNKISAEFEELRDEIRRRYEDRDESQQVPRHA